MISGDHMETAKVTALRAGIITEEEANNKDDRYLCMTGEDFRQCVGQLRKEVDAQGNPKVSIQNIQEFRNIATRLKVIARATPYDKYTLVVGLKQLGKTVAVTGDSLNDIDALKCADIGLAMSSGCSVAKDASDMILMKDNFESTLKTVMWGRNILSNVKRFIQFQVSVNITTLAVVLIGIIILGESPFATIHLLWINMIMDTFAALALATEAPMPSIILSPPSKKGENILTPAIWRQIYGVSLYIIAVMTIVMMFGKYMWDIDYYQTDALIPDPDVPGSDHKLKHYTIIFNTFIFMTLFNEINCRKIGSKDFNVFSNLLGNFYFVFIVGGILVAQFLLI